MALLGSVILLVVLISTTLAISCPSSTEQLFAHEECDKFYQCSNGIAVVQECPPGLNFNNEQQVCDFSQIVNCLTESSYSEDSSALVAAAECGKPLSESKLLPHANCNQFYKCSHGVPVPQFCPSGLSYDPLLSMCNWETEVYCNPTNFVLEKEASILDSFVEDNSPQAICAIASNSGLLLPHQECDKFYECASGYPFVLTCPENLLFDDGKLRCEWKDSVDCGDRTRL